MSIFHSRWPHRLPALAFGSGFLLALLRLVSACHDTGTGLVGASCQEKSDCATGLCLQATRYDQATGWHNGYCTTACDLTCYEGAACMVLGDQAYCMKQCQQDNECRSGYLCNPWYNVCLPDCRKGYDCAPYQCSADGYCVEDASNVPAKEKADIGAACRDPSDCASNYCLLQSKTDTGVAWSEGMCSQLCGECPDGSYCATLGDRNYCLPDCQTADSCRENYICHPTWRVCFPDCRTGYDCATYECGDQGFCTVAADDTTGAVPSKITHELGESCRMDSDCTSGLCFPQVTTPSGLAWTEGVCTQTCETCPAGFTCETLGQAAYCLASCQSDVNCRTGYTCNPTTKTCLPDCRLGFDCGSYVCSAQGTCLAAATLRAPSH